MPDFLTGGDGKDWRSFTVAASALAEGAIVVTDPQTGDALFPPGTEVRIVSNGRLYPMIMAIPTGGQTVDLKRLWKK